MCQGRSSLGLGDKVESSQTVSINKGRSVVLYPYAVKNIKWHFSSFFPTLSIVKLHFKGGGGEKRLFFFLNSKAHCESSFERANFTIGIFIWKKQQPKMLTLCRVPRPLCIDQCVCLLLLLLRVFLPWDYDYFASFLCKAAAKKIAFFPSFSLGIFRDH